ncbi:ABC transporter ATP-binding protein [Oceanobacillus indicireducens]|uniref:ABC transporter ATP-binding protein n=1 Tax=Oceanobacillus indicireducens TaxID=1004261 RepID=A0A917Y337_9BACI|nr:ABC transporter ATP-binding protein [Oceanobacillus indicireducens]GGN64923.1 ABC transporter ATP-binding protein [Oceanobacillus indicireducens]
MLVELKDIDKTYDRKSVLKNISLTIDTQEIIAILGGNGVGKSTLLRIIAGMERPSSGKIIFRNKKMNIGYVPERFPKNIRFTPEEYLNYTAKISGMPESIMNKSIPDLLKRFKLEQFNNQWVMNLSKGNIQKVGIIQAIIKRPDLLILDEPLSGLDSLAQQELLEIIKELKKEGTTILLTYHESNLFHKVIDTTYRVENGVLTKETDIVKEPIKLLEVEYLNESHVEKWDEIISIERKKDKLLLYVQAKDSDKILYRLLQLQGSIIRVVTVEAPEEDNR